MNLFNRLHHHIAPLIGALLLCASQAAYADDIEDANRLFKQGQHSQALDQVNGFLAKKPKDAQARFLKGLIFTEQGKITDAIKIFSALTEDYPELPEPYNNLAVLYASQGQYEKAKLALEMAIRTHPSYATAHENLGDIYAKMASQAYDRALQLDRSNTSTQTKLAMIQDLFGDNTRAKESSIQAHNTSGKIEVAAPAVEAMDKPVAALPVAVQPAPIKQASAVIPPAPADQNKEVLRTVNAWAAAWSSQDTNKYLSFYAADFKTPDGESRADWEATRRERLKKPASIQVGISNATVRFSDGDHATVSFRQSYRSSHLKTSGKKTLLMVKSGGKWLIQEERSK
ncbi:MAG: tetratricopeptide repeat protein [Gallionella sp.]